jgi:uncharacterized protein (TIGR04255 family)
MNLPVSISPCPIAEVTLGIQFEPTVPEDAIFGIIFQALRKDFPKATALPLSSLSAEIRRSDPQLAQQPLHKLDGEQGLSVLIGSQSATVAQQGNYPGWATLSGRFKETIGEIAQAGVIGRPTRFGLRYINFFEGDVFSKLTLSVAIANAPVTGDSTFFRSVLNQAGCRSLLQVGKDLALVQAREKVGTVIDIDSFVTNPDISDGFDETLSTFLDTSHLAEKQLFFSLLQPVFLSTLKPIYASSY